MVKTAQKFKEEEKPKEKKLEETASVLSKISELITLAVEKGRGPTAVTGHRYSEYLKGLERSGEEARKKRRKENPAEPQIPVFVKKEPHEKESHVSKTAVVPVPITEEALKAAYSLTAALDKAKNGKKLEWLA